MFRPPEGAVASDSPLLAALGAGGAAMRALVQRVTQASVSVGGEQIAEIGAGMLVLLGVRRGDGSDDALRIVDKLQRLRIFEDEDGRMNRSLAESGGEVLCVSQFTLYADTRKGNRPSFADAARPGEAEALYDQVRAGLGAQGGQFGAHMQVALVNDGPVTIVVDVD